MSSDYVVIVDGARTPMGGFQGSLSSVSAVDLGTIAIAEAVKRANLQPEDIQEVIMGCVLPAGLKQGPARQAMLDRKSTRLNSSHVKISYAVFCLKKKTPNAPGQPD